MNKRAAQLSLEVVIVGIILLVVLIVSILIFTKLMGSQGHTLTCKITDVSTDSNGNGVPDAVDPCPCPPFKQGDAGCFSCINCNAQATPQTTTPQPTSAQKAAAARAS